ncbi:MAG TPA: sensor histidine kinase [Proteiniphilum sp.]|nr:sensor histidine kinase [Proteiniphilum sp.]HPD86948.1 sensor histidine kinase [Proteiniphilum sp.]HPJ50171.1 sensor histidine kinase [Proteiniphilum sp.]HPR19573.1 sensor histidine kinase [Proteiniphilum sp.]
MVTLAMHMIDIVQNALRAQANMITITLDERGDESLLLFQVEDDGSGMSPEILERLSDPFFTTRTTRRVGLGIPFLKMTCEQTGGTLRVSSAEGEGTTVEALYRTDNPDCLPLGDLEGSLLLMVMANPGIRFRFTYRVGPEVFSFDSDALREQGIDLQHPQLVVPVKDYIRENLEALWRHRATVNYLC